MIQKSQATQSRAKAEAIDQAAMTRRAFFIGGASLVAAAIMLPKFARAEKMNLSSGVAIKGYDPVAYFTANDAMKGKARFSADYNGATYHFTSAANRDVFLAEPAKYTPKYGGFCAYAVSQGYTAPVDPKAFSVVDGALYLNYSLSVRKIWSQDIPGNIEKGDANWPKIGL